MQLILSFGLRSCYRVSLLFVFLFVIFSNLSAQTSDGTRSSVVKEVDGKFFFVHTVKKGESLYSISKLYSVTVEQIEANNKTTRGSVNEGAQLFIPKSDSVKYSEHVVQKGQTLYAICKQYSITIDDLIALNPDVKKGVDAGQKLKIPTKEVEVAAVKTVTHVVEKGQTLYSIGQQYAVTVDAIKGANPSVVSGLKIGDKLIIPSSGGIKGSSSVEKAVIKTDDDPGIHAVLKGETAFSIAKQYGTTVDELNAMNPGLKDGLKVGMVLQIPVKKKILSTILTRKTEIHVVEKGETSFSIAQKYEISSSDLLLLNPELKDGLKIGASIKVPVSDVIHADSLAKDTVVAQKKIQFCCDSLCVGKKQITVAICLPLYIRANDTIDLTGETMVKKEERLYPKSIPYIEFYEGALLALDSLKKSGLAVDLSVFDTQSDTTHGVSVVNALSNKSFDFILCLDDDAFENVARYAQEKRVPVVHPLSTNSHYVLTNPYCFLVNTPQPYRIEYIALSTAQMKDQNIIVVNNNHLQEQDYSDMYKSILGNDTSKFHTVVYSKKGIKGIEAVLVSSQKNVIVIPSEDQAFVNDVVTRIFQLSKKYDIDLQGFAVWETYKNLELDYLFDMHFSFATGNNRDYSSAGVKRFISDYRGVFHTEPSRLSFLGYDVFLHFSLLSQIYGNQLTDCNIRLERDGLQTPFRFQKISERGGYVNSGAYIIRYNTEMFSRDIQSFDIKESRNKYLNEQGKASSIQPLIKPISSEVSVENE